MLKILQARLQQYVNHELPHVQVGFRKARGTRDKIANIHWIIEKAREFQKNICFIDSAKAFDSVAVENSSRDHLTCLLRNLYEGQKCQKQGWASRPEFRVLALGLAADTRLLGKTARL